MHADLVKLLDLQQALMRAWRLPEMLTRITDDRHAVHPSARNVALAIRLARHTMNGWDNPAVPDDRCNPLIVEAVL